MKHIFLITFCLITISCFGQKEKQLKQDTRIFKTLYDAIIVKNDGDTVVGKMHHFKYVLTKASVYMYNEKNRLKKRKIRGTEISYLIIGGEYYGVVLRPSGDIVLSHRIINENGFEVYKTLGQMGSGNYMGANGAVHGTPTSDYNIYYLVLDGHIYELSDNWYQRRKWRKKIYTIFSKYDYFKSKINFESLETMSMEGVILEYLKLRKEYEADK
jgi:hypothetical protein